MFLKIENPLVSADWLYKHLNSKNLIVLDATILNVTDKKQQEINTKKQVKGAVFFDIKNIFSDTKSPLPNTVLTPKEFEEKAQIFGIQKNSALVVYDDLGIYASPRVWWMFTLMGFTNIAILDGGFPAWKAQNYPIESPKQRSLPKGDFVVNYQSEKLKYTQDVLKSIENNNSIIADARSKGRFYATEPEPRQDLKTGHIPTAFSLPHSEILENGFMKTKDQLKTIYDTINPTKKDFIFTCGSGITASVLAFGAALIDINNYAVYDGSWTEWGSTNHLPIEK
ncbi:MULTISPECIES: sulfurtransferase [unclassified Polaribacter]|uniref:sulfurtransferase n=1 Tax=unclassified Polaribacter TaxID=196858 RepID=UPI0011BF6CF3|nr:MULTISPECIES: sulfurtransferase [unclassified Polaribacter]TXD52523.1 sulfurtransferase [Polaribacter sp. IC063]TXD60509.1 sulfurtransferase [Polaribacter sp. IC066]